MGMGEGDRLWLQLTELYVYSLEFEVPPTPFPCLADPAPQFFHMLMHPLSASFILWI